MSILSDLLDKLNANYKENALAENIKLFQSIPKGELKENLTETSSFELDKDIEALLIVAKSYTEYALAKRNKLGQSRCLALLSRAYNCYSLASEQIDLVPPFSFNKTLGVQNTEANFYKHKTKFIMAKMDLFFIRKQIDSSEIDLKSMENSLQEVINEYSTFQETLKRDYKDPSLQATFSINRRFLTSITKELEEANGLISKLKKMKKRKASQEQMSLIKTETDIVIETGVTNDESSKMEQKDLEKEVRPKPAKRRKKVILMDDNEESEEMVPAPKPDLATSYQQMHFQMVPPSIVETLPDLSDPLSQLARPPSSLFRTLPALLGRSQDTLFTPIPVHQHTKDAKECFSALTDWQEAFKATKTHLSDAVLKSYALEKLGYAMLLAAGVLLEKSEPFKSKDTNPALRIAVRLFSKAAELFSIDPAKNARTLSNRYSELFIIFTKESDSTKHLSLLHKRYYKHGNRSGIHGLTVEETVTRLYEDLEALCSPEDYKLIKEDCANTLKRATEKLISSEVKTNGLSFNFN